MPDKDEDSTVHPLDVGAFLRSDNGRGMRIFLKGFAAAGAGFVIGLMGYFWPGYFLIVLGCLVSAYGMIVHWGIAAKRRGR
jgi:hypothetical protein